MMKKIHAAVSLILILVILSAICPVMGFSSSAIRYEAEDASYDTTYTKKANNYASGGFFISSPTSNAYCELTNIDGGNGGTATLNIAAATPNSNSKMHLCVNGEYYSLPLLIAQLRSIFTKNKNTHKPSSDAGLWVFVHKTGEALTLHKTKKDA